MVKSTKAGSSFFQMTNCNTPTKRE